MKYFLIIAIMGFLTCTRGLGQSKPPITDTTYKSWYDVGRGKITNDGKYAMFVINNMPMNGETWTIAATEGNWVFTSSKYRNLKFSDDSRCVFSMVRDTLFKHYLGSDIIEKIPRCKNYFLLDTKNAEWIVLELESNGKFVIRNLNNEQTFEVEKVSGMIANAGGNALLMKKETIKGQEDLIWLDLVTGKKFLIYRGLATRSHIFDRSGTQMAFTALNNGSTQIWHYKCKWQKAKFLVDDSSEGVAPELKINVKNTWQFNEDGQYLFFNLSGKTDTTKNSSNVLVRSFEDSVFYEKIKGRTSTQLDIGKNFSVLDVNQKSIKQLLSGNQKVDNLYYSHYKNSILVSSSSGDPSEMFWNDKSRVSYSTCSIKTGLFSEVISPTVEGVSVIKMSPSNRYVVYHNAKSDQFKCYDVVTKRTRDLGLSKLSRPGQSIAIEGWIDGTENLIVRYGNDLWKLNLGNNYPPKNLTRQSSKSIAFAVNHDFSHSGFDPNEKLIVFGANLDTKEHLIYSLDLKSDTLHLDFVTNNFLSFPSSDISTTVFAKAGNSNSFLLKLGSAKNSPNYFFTKDFRNVKQLSDIHPERDYNWISSELIRYKSKEGEDWEGILYKPEDFDPKKKYPVIFSIYQLQSEKLNLSIYPAPSVNGVNIPLLTSNGYLVFVPNIYQKKGCPGESALNSVMAATDCLSKNYWVNANKMAIVGHSLGGFETNYIVTHTNRFVAAYSAAGVSNLAATFNRLFESAGMSQQDYVINNGFHVGVTLQNAPEVYIKNSPIFYAKNIETPFLLMHNDKDDTIPLTESLELFIQLRSLKKPVWLLQYRNEGHQITNENNQIDCQKKVLDFFDHFLRGRPMSGWMTKHL
jgi:dipeptidyl aminopeptidase/acylaminoacyl peptidase